MRNANNASPGGTANLPPPGGHRGQSLSARGPRRGSNPFAAGGGLLLAAALAANDQSLGTTNLTEGPAAGAGSVVLAETPATSSWTATANDAWLHLSTADQSGIGSTNVIFTVDANAAATRTGTLTVASMTLMVTQAGATYVAANPLTTLVSSGWRGSAGFPLGVAVDGAGNVSTADNHYDGSVSFSAVKRLASSRL